jgi:hypothetical protein
MFFVSILVTHMRNLSFEQISMKIYYYGFIFLFQNFTDMVVAYFT